ncbi:MAG: tetrathionate reductase family octaheme c-type cytochrome [Planctomycetales bacterium]|nr:tetrathionate reductase family octaheme c-type cytochrome [Planctomycetales bacterium]
MSSANLENAITRFVPLVLLGLAIATTVLFGHLRQTEVKPTPLEVLQTQVSHKHVPSVDHTKLAALQREFDSPQEVTEACLSCHTERGHEVMASSHWNWDREEFVEGHGIRAIGKKNVLNNYCVGVSSNLQACDKCHAGYGFVDDDFDFHNPLNIDCLVCHDNSGTYAKSGSGLPAASVNLTEVAQHVGRTSRDTCGSCHFFGGGGNNVKHGDLEQALFDPDREVDVHMATGGANLVCSDCHITRNHQMQGKLYSVSSMNRNRSSCEQCHTEMPHDDNILNEHTLKVACQTCHIPHYAKVAATKTTWDWSTAGKLKDGQPYEQKDQLGNVTYMSEKGTFGWEQNAEPEYAWFNGTAGHYLLGDKVSDQQPIPINQLHGSYADPDAKIIPVKVHRGKQLYDPVQQMLIQPKLVAAEKGAGAFWKDFNWETAATAGMQSIGLTYSGQHRFAETSMTWPINHMVAPKEQSLQCADCHHRTNSRLANLTGFYMPGRDRNVTVDRIGQGLIGLVFLGVVTHGAGRIWLSRQRSAGEPS